MVGKPEVIQKRGYGKVALERHLGVTAVLPKYSSSRLVANS